MAHHDIPRVDDGDGAAFRARLGSGLGWSLANSLITRVLTVLLGIVMARLLVPEDYGVFAVGVVVLAVLQSMNELGVSVAVITWSGSVERVARTATTLAVGSSFLLYAVCYVAAPHLAGALGSRDATSVLRLLALGVVVDGVSSIPNAGLMRSFQQGKRALIDLVAVCLSSSVSITLAVRGHGAMSLAWGTLAGNMLASTLILCLSPLRPRPGWLSSDARALLRVGLPLAGTSLAMLAVLNVDYVIIGRTLGPASLGFYLLAFNLSSWPPNLLSVAVRRVAIPAFARLAHDTDRLSAAFARSFAWLALAGAVAVVPMALLAEPLVETLYGDRWLPSVTALRGLALFGLLRVVIDLSYDALVATGRAMRLLVIQLIWFAVLWVAIEIGVRQSGIRGAALAHALVAGVIILPTYLLVLNHAGIRCATMLRALFRPALGAAAGAAVILTLRAAFSTGIWALLVPGALGPLVVLLVGAPPADRRAIVTWVRASRTRRADDELPAPEALV